MNGNNSPYVNWLIGNHAIKARVATALGSESRKLTDASSLGVDKMKTYPGTLK
jgi:hypothetical protein